MNFFIMRNRSVIWIVFFMYTAICFSQKNESGLLLKKANEVLYDDPGQALKIGEYLLRNPDTHEKAPTAMLLAKGNLVSGNYTQSIANIQLTLAEAKSAGDPKILFDTFLLAAEIYANLDLFEISKKYSAEAGKIARSEPVLKKKLKAYGLFVSDTTPNGNDLASFLKTLTPDDMAAYSFISKGTPLQLTARNFMNASRMDSASVYFEKSLKDIAENNRGAYWNMIAMADYSDYFFEKKDYPKAIELLEEALEKGKAIHNAYFIKAINEKLSVASLASGNKAKFMEFRQKAAAAENDYDTQITLATNIAFENLQKEREVKMQQAQRFQQNTYMTLGISALALLLLWLVVKWLFAMRTKHIEDIINYLKLIKNTEEKPQPVTKEIGKTLSIPKETEDLLLSKLEKFEGGKKYLSKDISLAQMASMFETNTKYLSEVINKYKRKNFNSYINELRIRYIVKKLKNDPQYLNYKVSYLAEECGFSSHSIFSAAFKSITGLTPNVFIQFLSKDVHQTEKEEFV